MACISLKSTLNQFGFATLLVRQFTMDAHVIPRSKLTVKPDEVRLTGEEPILTLLRATLGGRTYCHELCAEDQASPGGSPG